MRARLKHMALLPVEESEGCAAGLLMEHKDLDPVPEHQQTCNTVR